MSPVLAKVSGHPEATIQLRRTDVQIDDLSIHSIANVRRIGVGGRPGWNDERAPGETSCLDRRVGMRVRVDVGDSRPPLEGRQKAECQRQDGHRRQRAADPCAPARTWLARKCWRFNVLVILHYV